MFLRFILLLAVVLPLQAQGPGHRGMGRGRMGGMAISIPTTLPTATSELFAGSGTCVLCHAGGGGSFQASDGRNVSPVTLWQATMMANAYRDPVFRAKVQAEIQENPSLETYIEDKCLTCHAPMAFTEAHRKGNTAYRFQQADADPLAKDGVSCTLCHQIVATNFGQESSFSGGYQVNENHETYGPHQYPIAMPMIRHTGYKPVYSEHVAQSALCATCHTLFTPTVNDQGDVVGEIPEQTPFLEWLNSVYPDSGLTCQACHMPALQERLRITTMPMRAPRRSPIHLHEFVGGNAYVLALLERHGKTLKTAASPKAFQEKRAQVERNLQQAARLELRFQGWKNDTLEVAVWVHNLTGHKFPTGYPSRRAWLELEVLQKGTPVFHSGAWDATTGDLQGLDTPYEPHHQVIHQPHQVQVYESVMVTPEGQVTQSLLRALRYVKDNRIPPKGFRAQGPYTEHTAILGRATQDPDFNRWETSEGTGADRVIYRIGNLSPQESYTLRVTLWYQTLKPRFLRHLWNHSGEWIQKLQQMVQEMPETPVAVATATLEISP